MVEKMSVMSIRVLPKICRRPVFRPPRCPHARDACSMPCCVIKEMFNLPQHAYLCCSPSMASVGAVYAINEFSPYARYKHSPRLRRAETRGECAAPAARLRRQA